MISLRIGVVGNRRKGQTRQKWFATHDDGSRALHAIQIKPFTEQDGATNEK